MRQRLAHSGSPPIILAALRKQVQEHIIIYRRILYIVFTIIRKYRLVLMPEKHIQCLIGLSTVDIHFILDPVHILTSTCDLL